MSRRREVFVPPIVLDRASAGPLHRQMYRQIAEAIRAGVIPSEARLPSTRMMAKRSRLSRNTVLAAYEELAADDLVRGEPGSGMRVNRGSPMPALSLSGLRQVIREANFPARTLVLADPDGNPLYLRH